MDNFFQIIFYIILILVFVSSLFKKKPQGTQGKPGNQMPAPGRTNRMPEAGPDYYQPDAKEDDDNDILAEIENMFKTETPGNIPPAKKETKIETYNREKQQTSPQDIPDEYSKWPGTPTPQTQQTIVKDVEQISAEIKQIDSKIEQEALSFQKHLEEEKNINVFVISLREKLKSPQSLKEYFVISEIIGKPVCMKNRQNYLHR